MDIKSTNVWGTPPPTQSDENQRVAERPALKVETGDGASPSSRGRSARKSALQNQLLRKVLLKNVHRQLQIAPPMEGGAQRVAPPAGNEERIAALAQLNKAIRFGNDAQITDACKLIKRIVNEGPRIDETGVECLEKLVPWLRTSQNTSKIKSLKELAQSTNADEVKKTMQQFANVQSQTQMPMEDRIFGAVERLRERMRTPDPAGPMKEDNVAGLQRLEQALLTRDFKQALDVYKVVVRGDDRPEKEIERDVKDFRKLVLYWLTLEQNKSPIKSLQAMVENADIASVKQVIDEFAAGNSPQESTRQRVFSIVLTLRRLAWEAASVSSHMSGGTQSPQLRDRGAKRRAPEEACGNSVRRARRETNSAPKEDAVASDAALDKELNEELKAILASSDAPPSLFRD